MTCLNTYLFVATIALIYLIGYGAGFTVPRKPTIKGGEE